LLFSITSLIAWFMPVGFKHYLNARGQGNGVSIVEWSAQVAGDTMAGKLGSALVMSIIEHLGNKLAPRINKSPGAVKGLLLVSIEAAEKQHGAIGIDFTILHDSIVIEVKNRLEHLGIPDVQSIIDELTHDVVDIQSLLVVGKF
jgi:hypothetical protein